MPREGEHKNGRAAIDRMVARAVANGADPKRAKAEAVATAIRVERRNDGRKES